MLGPASGAAPRIASARKAPRISLVGWIIFLLPSATRPGESPCTALPQANSIAPFYRLFNQRQAARRDAVSKCLVPLYSCNTLRTKVNKMLTQDSEVGEDSIIEEREHHERKNQGKAEAKAYFLHLHTERTPPDGFNQIVQKVAAVEHGYR